MIVLVLIVIIGVIIVRIRENQRGKSDLCEVEKNEETIPTFIHYSDEFNRKESTEIANHIVSTIFVYEEKADMWICPSCETENSLSKKSCCICHYIQQEGV